ncbi:MAG: glycosyltransferase family 39 protein [Candidatus Daviesbacteria bacterium]|nr:glycosyltransferase family 39 protein [Candidatus Daviesbacteria bacterium]
MTKLLNEKILLVIFIILFISIRSIHYPLFLNFSKDQALFSIEALNIDREKPIKLLGPPVSINFEGRQVFQGPAIYYFQLLFLKLGNFDPLTSSYLFMIFSAFMILPLYYGMKLLVNKRVALALIIIYSLLPYYINYTRFFWNPNFQFSLVPILVLLLGIFKQTRSKLFFLLVSIFMGFLLQFHYQFIIIILGLLIYFFSVLKIKYTYLIIMIGGFSIGFFPLILFEIRNNFYNLQTTILYLNNPRTGQSINFSEISHYFLSLSIFSIIVLFSIFNKLNKLFLVTLFIGLFIWSLVLYIPKPTQSFRTVKNWNYLNEEIVYKTIKEESLSNFNVVNLSYDTLALVQKYFLKRDSNTIDFANYSNNKYLYVINSDTSFMNNPAYEINTFKPSSIIKQWPINTHYNLYLLERN